VSTGPDIKPAVLPTRDGVGASCVSLPEGPWTRISDFLVQRFAHLPAKVWLQRIEDGEVVDEAGLKVTAERPYQPHLRVYYYRSVAAEARIPFDEVLLFLDEHLAVVDKPHFLPVLPSGQYLQETVLVRLKRRLGIDSIVPIHRIDRDTAGIVMFSLQPATRDAYHGLFRQHAVHKTYQAIASWRPELRFPLTRESRLGPAEHFMQQREVPGVANSLTHIRVLEVQGTLARYALQPVTGHRHQLRVHMAALGMPILNDGIYPELTPEAAADYQRPLQLLAQSIAFKDPLTGLARHFESQLQLALPERQVNARGPVG
jgi:tRNA pseudouridine32 synthase/23S rRNA pseudouridine746 synthase